MSLEKFCKINNYKAYQDILRFCKEKDLEPPTEKEFSDAGCIVKHHKKETPKTEKAVKAKKVATRKNTKTPRRRTRKKLQG